jgi:hypothetical protein
VARSRTRLPAALLALIWIGAPLATTVHTAVDSHTWCPEHQALEEGSPLERAEATEHATVAGDQPDADAHEDCASDDLYDRSFTPTIDGPAIGSAPVSDSPVLDAVSLVDAPAIPILSFAPKSSPPAIG